jgi:hypothetical protein
LPARSGLTEINSALETLAAAVGQEDLREKLWIVEIDRIREYADDRLSEDDEP